jgi:hypothetical protein
MQAKSFSAKEMKSNFSEIFSKAIIEVYGPAGFVIEDIFEEKEGTEYGPHRFRLDDKHVVFRVAKTTPTKIGQFVTLWKRPKPDDLPSAIGNKPAPLHCDDGIDFVIIYVHNETHRGQFIFNKEILVEKGIMATGSTRGKTAFRIYPPWSEPVAVDAIKSQKWQIHYFVGINESNDHMNLEKLRILFQRHR